jgi:hypothetical protein
MRMCELLLGNSNKVVALFASRGVVITRHKLSPCAIVCVDVDCSSTSRDYAQQITLVRMSRQPLKLIFYCRRQTSAS